MNRLIKFLKRPETWLVVGLLVVAGLAHGWNMTGYPYIENDEATYISRGWQFVTTGQLDVYTYRYDHAPLGWITIGTWLWLTGGADNLFGSFVTSGRVFMLIIHVSSCVLLYAVTKRLTHGSKAAGFGAVLIFSLSPLGIYFQRRILLDNLMTFWVLLSLWWASRPAHQLHHYIWSAVFLGIAVLTKLNAIFFLPAFWYLIWKKADPGHRLHALLYWTFVVGAMILVFFLYAALKGELLPAPRDASGQPLHVSMVETFQLQLGRGDFAWPWQARSSFRLNLNTWALKDPFILLGGAIGLIGLTAMAIWRRRRYPYLIVLAVACWLYLLFLARGKIVIDLYIVPYIPLLAATIASFWVVLGQELWPRRWRWFRRVHLAAGFILLLLTLSVLGAKPYTVSETSNQQAALDWVQAHIPTSAHIVADNYVYPYLAQQRAYQHVSYFFTAEYDPEVRQTYEDDWRNIEYLILTHEILSQIKAGTTPKMKLILDHSELVADFTTGASSFIDLPNYISTNGDWAQVYRVKSRNEIVLQDSWAYFKDHYIMSYGQVVDPNNQGLTTSYSQAQALNRAVAENDKAMFAGLWQWTQDHLRHRQNDSLLSWKWAKNASGVYGLADANNVCSADQLTAAALFLADEKWPGQGYASTASRHTADWWSKCVFKAGGRWFVDSSADGSRNPHLVNPGYFDPNTYAYLATKVPQYAWAELVRDNYTTINSLLAADQLPDWVLVSAAGEVTSARSVMGPAADSFGYDSLLLVYHLVEESTTPDKTRAQTARSTLTQIEPLLRDFRSRIASPPADIAWLMYGQTNQIVDSEQLQTLYTYEIHDQYHVDGYWGEGGSYLDQVWYWQWHNFQRHLPASLRMELK